MQDELGEGLVTDSTESAQLSAHLSHLKLTKRHLRLLPQVRRHHHSPSSPGRNDDDGHLERKQSTLLQDFITEAVLGSAPRKAKENEREVGDEFFRQPGEKEKDEIVRLTIGRFDGKKHRKRKKLKEMGGRLVGVGRVGTLKEGKRTGSTPLVVVHEHEEEDGDSIELDGAGAGAGALYPASSLVESPDNTSEESLASFSTSGDTPTYPPTPRSATSLALPFTSTSTSTSANPNSTQPPYQRRLRTFSSGASSLASEFNLGPTTRIPSRTLTLDETLPQSKKGEVSRRHRHRVTKEKGGKLNLQDVLRDRVRKIRHGGSQAGRVEGEEEMMERELKRALIKAGVEAGVVKKDEEKELWETDILWECQRGLMMFGLPRFSSAALAQFDPPAWTDASFHPSAYTPHNHPLPTPFWHWHHSTWLVDMGLDTDESGWQYAYRFQSKHWRGEADSWRSFVRRRRWIRTRVYRPVDFLSDPKDGSGEGGDGDWEKRDDEAWDDWVEERKRLIKRIDWDALRNSEFADRRTLRDGSAVDEKDGEEEDEDDEGFPKVGVFGLKSATALLPLSVEKKDDIFSWEGALEFANPFLSWMEVQKDGEQILLNRSEATGEAEGYGNRSDDMLIGVWRDAVVEINFRRIGRVLREARLDREKLGLWKWWLNVKGDQDEDDDEELRWKAKGLDETKSRVSKYCEVLGRVGASREDSLFTEDGVPTVRVAGGGGGEKLDSEEEDARNSKRPAKGDVWDLLENRLDPILQIFEFQQTRLRFLRLLLSLHNTDDPDHVYQGPTPFGIANRVDFYRDAKELMETYERESLEGGGEMFVVSMTRTEEKGKGKG